jgi:hypothetical protein
MLPRAPAARRLLLPSCCPACNSRPALSSKLSLVLPGSPGSPRFAELAPTFVRWLSLSHRTRFDWRGSEGERRIWKSWIVDSWLGVAGTCRACAP